MERGLKNTFIYHSIKPLFFGSLFAAATVWLVFAIINFHTVNVIFAATFEFVTFLTFLVSFIQICYCMYCYISYQRYQYKVITDPDNVIIIEGLPGAGKSLTVKQQLVTLSEAYWAQIVEDYTIMSHIKHEHYREPDWMEHYNELKNVFEYYSARPWLQPCAMSNVPISIDGRAVARFDFKMLLQLKNMGYKTVCIIDEVKSAGLSNRDSGNAPKDLDDTFRFIRQFYEAKILITDQDKLAPSIELRRVATTYTMQSLDKDILRPRAIQWAYNRMKRKFLKKYGVVNYIYVRIRGDITHGVGVMFRYIKDCKHIYCLAHKQLRAAHAQTEKVHHLQKVKDITDSIGFFRFVRVYRGSTQGNTVTDARQSVATAEVIGRDKVLKYYTPALQRFKSDTRLFRGVNRAKDIEFNPEVWMPFQTTVDRQYWDDLEKERAKYFVKKEAKAGKGSESEVKPS